MLLLTGAPGWLGNRLVEILSDGAKDLPPSSKYPRFDKIRCLALPSSSASFFLKYSGTVEVVKGNVVDQDSLIPFFKDAEEAILYHLAGIIHPEKGIKQFYDVNVRGTENILEMAYKSKIKKILVMSSNSQSGCNPHSEHRFTEESPYNPYLNYGRSKMLMEQVAGNYINLHDMDVTIIRTCWFYGPHQPPRQTEFFTMIKEGRFPIVGDGTNVRSMSYVDNICQGMLLASQVGTKGKTYWIADERAYQMNEIVDTAEAVLEQDFGISVRHKRLNLPGTTGTVAYMVDNLLQRVGLYNKKIHVLSELNKNIACSIELAQKELGYNPAISLREGMRRSVEWCLNNGLKI